MCGIGIFWLFKYALHIEILHKIGLLGKGSLICIFFDAALIFYGVIRLLLFSSSVGYSEYSSYMGGHIVSESDYAAWNLAQKTIGIGFSLFCCLLFFVAYMVRQYNVPQKYTQDETSPHTPITLLLFFTSLIMLPISFVIWIALLGSTQLITGG